MLSKLRGQKGFTLIELMIVIAIIGILAAIAIPNFIAYRNKTYCSAAESDAANIAAAISDYFSEPDNVTISTTTIAISYTLSDKGGQNTFTLSGGTDPSSGMTIRVYEASNRCPRDNTNHDYVLSMPKNTAVDGW